MICAGAAGGAAGVGGGRRGGGRRHRRVDRDRLARDDAGRDGDGDEARAHAHLEEPARRGPAGTCTITRVVVGVGAAGAGVGAAGAGVGAGDDGSPVTDSRANENSDQEDDSRFTGGAASDAPVAESAVDGIGVRLRGAGTPAVVVVVAPSRCVRHHSRPFWLPKP